MAVCRTKGASVVCEATSLQSTPLPPTTTIPPGARRTAAGSGSPPSIASCSPGFVRTTPLPLSTGPALIKDLTPSDRLSPLPNPSRSCSLPTLQDRAEVMGFCPFPLGWGIILRPEWKRVLTHSQNLRQGRSGPYR